MIKSSDNEPLKLRDASESSNGFRRPVIAPLNESAIKRRREVKKRMAQLEILDTIDLEEKDDSQNTDYMP